MEDNLVSRRSKRSTAGNRMQAALAEMSIDDLMQDAEEDIDFVSKVEEEDMFESDFAETDEEMDDDDAGEKTLEEEERRARRAARAKTLKTSRATAPKVTFGSLINEEHAGTSSSVVKARSQRRVSLGQAIDAATGEILESSKRQSTREATRMNTQELRSRLKDAYSRKAIVPKRPKEAERRRTQADLIAAALDTEEENTKSHREYLIVEEERRKKARVIKPTTVGPKLRWRSRMENVTVTVYEPAPVPHPVYQSRPMWPSPFAQGSNIPGSTYANPYAVPPPGQAPPMPHAPAQFSSAQYSYSYTPQPAVTAATAGTSNPKSEAAIPQPPPVAVSPIASLLPSTATPSVPSTSTPSSATAPPATTENASPTVASPTVTPAKSAPVKATTTSPTPAPTLPPTSTTPSVPPVPLATPATPYNGYYHYSYYTPQAGATPQPPYQPFSPYYAYPPPVGPYPSQPRPHLQLQPPQQVACKKTEKQAKNYVEILLNDDSKSKPEWREVMNVLFGRHADWDNVRVYYGKNRPVSRQVHTCPITGLQARYRDPRSGVPYANAGAFRILTRLLAHEYVWSPDGINNGVFIGHEKQRGALGVPERWGEAMGGVGEGWQRKAIEEKTAEKEKVDGRKDEKQKEKTKQKEKEKRVGGRRSSRIAGDVGNATVKIPDSDAMDVDKPDESGEVTG